MMTPKKLARELEARLDGPHNDEHTASAAELAAEAIRFLNYATGSHSPEGLVYPATVYSIAADLSSAAWRMQQLFDQLRDWLTVLNNAGMLGTDDGTPTSEVIAEARANLAYAAGAASHLSSHLSTLHNTLSTLNGRGPKREQAPVSPAAPTLALWPEPET
jgi:hypothetical protein